jgi:hypothetical protein
MFTIGKDKNRYGGTPQKTQPRDNSTAAIREAEHAFNKRADVFGSAEREVVQDLRTAGRVETGISKFLGRG